MFGCVRQGGQRQLSLVPGIQQALEPIEDARFSQARFRRWSTLNLLRRAEQNRFNSFSNFSGTRGRMLADLCAAPAAGEYFVGIEKPGRIEDLFDAHHRLKVGIREDQIHEIFFLVPDTMFAAKRPSDSDTQFHDLFAHAEDLVDLIGIAAIEKNQRMEVTVAGMKYICHAQAVTLRHMIDRNKNFRQPRPLNDTTHCAHILSKTDHGTEGPLAAQPQLRTFFVVLGNADVVSAIPSANIYNRARCFLEAFTESVYFDQYRRHGILRI